ncbi:OCIA domain-containing protein 1 [Topomyia yanbarensis]|uniref:OCIA domain-containing protein 1 n=1 Tax=Topomyia yanbarensis TaxID=2498891 RepID=UPI00273CC551|nr:OCIA domain-containing protein 1 [Topomyia yanbarensis]
MDRAEQVHALEDGQRNALNYKFSPEELKVLQECNREAFFQRSLPFGTICGIGTWYAVQRGYLKASQRFGAGPKVFIGITLGYFMGKLSYQTRCADKIMRIPNSRLAELIRQRRQGGPGGVERLLPDQGLGAGSMLSPFGPTSPSDSYTEKQLDRSDTFNLDIHVPQYSGLDDSGRPTLDSNQAFDEDLQLPPSPQVTKSYEELRRQNREEYVKRHQAPYRSPVLDDQPPIRREVDRPKYEDQPQPSLPKNKYGDTWSQ